MTINKYSIISIIAVVVVGVIALFYSGVFDENKITLDDGRALPQVECNFGNDQKAYQEAINDTNLGICGCIEQSELKSSCEYVVRDLDLYKNAISQYDSFLCEDIANNNKKNACFQAIKGSNPTKEQALLLAQKGSYTFKEEDYAKKSLKILNEMLSKDNKNIDILLGIGYSYEIMENYDKSLFYYNKALALDSENASIYNRIGHMYDLSEGADKAKPFYLKALELDSEFLNAQINLARVYLREGNNKEKGFDILRKVYLNKEINDRSRAETAYLLFAEAFDEGDYGQARKYIEEARKADETLPVVWVGMGLITSFEIAELSSPEGAEEMLDRALGYFDKASSLYEYQTSAYYWKGRIVLAVGDKEGANLLFKTAKNVLKKDITLMNDQRINFEKDIDIYLLKTKKLSFLYRLFGEEVSAAACCSYWGWENGVWTNHQYCVTWCETPAQENAIYLQLVALTNETTTVVGNTVTCANGASATWTPIYTPPVYNAPTPAPTCTYKDSVTEWSACENGAQVALNWTEATVSGNSCTDVALTQLCSTCGNNICEAGETAETCPSDCDQGITCGDGVCDIGESVLNCSVDCPAVCGDGTCDPGESSITCSSDCDSVCGNTICESGETIDTCVTDCAVCGDGVCSTQANENEVTCSTDCNPIPGNGLCGAGEETSYPLDCAPVCGDSTCETDRGENFLNCRSDCFFEFKEI